MAARRIERGLGSAADCALLFGRAEEVMKRRGFLRRLSETPAEFAAALASSGCPQEAALLLRQITSSYNRARFANDVDAVRQLPALVRSLEALP